jgi:hypothetical protein
LQNLGSLWAASIEGVAAQAEAGQTIRAFSDTDFMSRKRAMREADRRLQSRRMKKNITRR